MLSERIKYAMDHLSHKQHISLLARPNWRRIQKKHVHILVSFNNLFLSLPLLTFVVIVGSITSHDPTASGDQRWKHERRKESKWWPSRNTLRKNTIQREYWIMEPDALPIHFRPNNWPSPSSPRRKAPPLFPRIHPKTLAAKTTKRINDLALPTKRWFYLPTLYRQ